MANLIRILSIDGGGIRGLIPGEILAKLEQILQNKTHNPQARIADYFDLIAGTSTGGLLTCFYLFPALHKNLPTKKARFSAKEAVDFYLQLGPQIFKRSLFHQARSLGGLIREKYPADSFETSLKQIFGDLKLSQLLKPCLITAYNIEKRYAHFFTQHDAVADQDYDFYLRDVARAASAAPTFFQAAGITSLRNHFYPLIDGAVFANNPAFCAYSEVYRTFKNAPSAENLVILSLGTGADEKPLSFSRARHWGIIQWAVPILSVLMSGNPETVNYQLKTIFSSVNRSGQYLRIDPRIPDPLTNIDNASLANMQALREVGQKAAAKYQFQLEELADMLIANFNRLETLIEAKRKRFSQSLE